MLTNTRLKFMEKSRTLCQRLLEDPQLRGNILEASREGYEASYRRGILSLKAGNPRSLAHALSTLQKVKQKGLLPELLGKHTPLFQLRSWWPEQNSSLEESLIQQSIFAGFNALVLKGPEEATLAREYGLLVISEGLSPWSDVAFYTSNPKRIDREKTYGDCVLEEMKELELQLHSKQKLIFYLPAEASPLSRQCRVLNEIRNLAGPNTTLAFDAETDQPHPYWKELRASPFPSATPLLPLLSFSSPRWDFFRSRLIRHPFAGLFHRKSTSPSPEKLWVQGQALYFNCPIDHILEMTNLTFKGQD